MEGLKPFPSFSFFPKNKKGQLTSLDNISSSTMTVIFIILVIIMGIITLGLFLNMSSSYNPQTKINETGGFINATGYTLANELGASTRLFSITTIVVANLSNGSIFFVVPPANYTLDVETGIIKNATATIYDSANNYTVNISYSNSITNAVGNSVINGTSTVGNISGGTLVAVGGTLVAVLIIGLIVVVIFFVRRMNGGGATE